MASALNAARCRSSAGWRMGERNEGGRAALDLVVNAGNGNSLIDRTREIVSGLTMVLPAELDDAQLDGFLQGNRINLRLGDRCGQLRDLLTTSSIRTSA